VLIAVALMASSGCSAYLARETAAKTPTATTASPSASDIRLLPTVDMAAVSRGLWRPEKLAGYVHIGVTPGGFCASLSEFAGAAPTAAFFWPAGYAVRSSGPASFTIVDEHGRLVANDGDYLYVAGHTTSGSWLPDGTQVPCPSRGDQRVMVVQQHGAPGTPIGVATRPVVALDSCGVPRPRPHGMTLACADAGLMLDHMRYTRWGRDGAGGTARVVMLCYPGNDHVRVHFSFGPARLTNGLLALSGPQIRYPRRPCGK